MSKDMYLVTGEALNYIPIVSETQIIDDFEEISVEHEDTAVEPESAEEELSDFEAIEDDIDEDNYENSDEDNNEDIIDISLDEDEPVNEYTHEEILAGIEEKSDSAIASIKENLETPKDIDIFEDTDEEIQDEELSESIETEAEETENVELVQEEGSDDSENLQEFDEDESDDTLSEFDNEEFTEENLVPDLAEINEESVSISEVSDEDMVVENIELNQEISHEELSEEMLEENLEPEDSTELIHEDDNSEQLEMDTEELDNGDEISLEEVPAEETVELDSDVEMLIENQDEPEEEYPQNTTLDVDFSEPKIMPLTGEALNHDFDEIVELDSSEAAEDDIIVDMSNDEQINVDEEVEQEIIEDVDKVYTTMKDDNELEEISDSDLDLIDALNNDGEELEEYNGEELQEVSDSDSGIIEEVHSEPDYKTNDADEILEHKESSTPIVPLYDADIPQEDMVMSDPIQQGDAVLHAKYGNGVVEKMIKYGNKTLYAINFENIGRRLLDPTLTEIKRV